MADSDEYDERIDAEFIRRGDEWEEYDADERFLVWLKRSSACSESRRIGTEEWVDASGEFACWNRWQSRRRFWIVITALSTRLGRTIEFKTEVEESE